MLGKECDAAKLSPQQMQACVAVCQVLVGESMERREERQKHAAEDEVDEEEEETLAEEAEREEILIQSIVEGVGSLLKVYHSAMLPLFDSVLLPIFQPFLQPTAIDSDRVAALCVFDDLIEHTGADGGNARYVPVLLPVFLQYAADNSVEVRQAAVYGLGIMAEHGGAAFDASMQQQAAQALGALIEKPDAFSEENGSATDNAVSALGKLCKVSEPIAAQALPRWLQTLPLKSDKEEARTVHRQLVEFCEASNPHLLGASTERLPDIIIVFGQVLGTDLLEEEVAGRIGNLLKQVRSGLPHVLQGLPSNPGFVNLSAEQKAELEKAISS